jgi:hypothetical protein
MSEQSFLDEEIDIDAQEATSFDLLTAGRYWAEVAKVSSSPLKSGKGNAINFQWRISQGERAGRSVFQAVIFQHENQDTQKFGLAKLKDICIAMGITGKLSDLTVFYHHEVQILVGIEKDKTGAYPDKNCVKRVMPLETVHVHSSNGKANDLNDSINF